MSKNVSRASFRGRPPFAPFFRAAAAFASDLVAPAFLAMKAAVPKMPETRLETE